MEYRLRWESDNLDKEKIFRCDSIEEAQKKFLSASKEVKKERIIHRPPSAKSIWIQMLYRKAHLTLLSLIFQAKLSKKAFFLTETT